MLYVLADGFTAEKKQFEVFRARVLAGLGRHAQPLAGAKEHELTGVDWLAFRPGGARAGEDVGERIEGRFPRKLEQRPGRNRGVHQRDGRVGRARAGHAGQVTRDHPDQGARVGRSHQRHVAGFERLVSGRDPLFLRRQVDPQLDAMEEPSRDDQRFRGSFDVQDAPPSSHPLGGTVGNEAATSV